MPLFAKNKKTTECLVIGFHSDGISAASIKHLPNSRPVVGRLAFYGGSKLMSPQSLDKLSKDLHASQYSCSNLLAAGEYQLLSVDAPNVPQNELKTAIRWRLKDMLDFHVDDATIDVLDVPIEKDAPVRAHSMYVVAARNQLIEQRQALFESAKMPLTVIDIPEMAQRNIAALFEPEGRGLAVLSFDADGGLLTVTFAGELYLARRLDVSLQQIMQVSEEEENALHDRITLELQRSLDHFDRQYRHITLSKLMLFPLGVPGTALQTYLSSNLYVPVEMMDLETVLDISKAPELKRLESQQRYFLTLGAALRLEETVP